MKIGVTSKRVRVLHFPISNIMKKALIIDNHTKHLDQLRSLIPCETEVIDWNDFKTIGDSHYDVIILTGGSNMPPVAEYPEAYTNEQRLIRETSIPLIGICLGCELIAHEFGADIKVLDTAQKGFVSIAIHPPFDAAFPQKNMIAYEAHSRAITNLPDTFDLVATSDHGPEIIHHRKRNLWGIQFHPEHLTDRTLGDEIFISILKRCLHS